MRRIPQLGIEEKPSTENTQPGLAINPTVYFEGVL